MGVVFQLLFGFSVQRESLAPVVRAQLKRLPAPHADHDGVVPLPPPRDALDLITIARRHEAAVTAMARADALARDTSQAFRFSRLLSRQEAVSSSTIEGTESTLDEILSNEETGSETTRDALQVRDYAVLLGRYVERARAKGPAIFTRDLVCDLHAEIMRADASCRDTPGALRTTSVWIGAGPIAHASWIAAPPDDVEACLAQSLDYMCGATRDTQSFVTRLAVGHAHFEAVHPFRDGNGRVGRVLLPLAMAAEGHVPLYLSPFIEARRGGYYGALRRASQQLDWAAIVGFFCDAVVATVAHVEETIALLDRLRAAWDVRKTFRKGSTALRALDVLVDYPVLTANRLAQEVGVGFGRASEALAQLAEIGIVAERTGYRRNRVFVARDVMAIVDRPFEA